MRQSITSAFSLTLLSFGIAACAAEDAGPSSGPGRGGKGDGSGDHSLHYQKVVSCQGMAARAQELATSTLEMTEIEAMRQNCLLSANNGALGTIYEVMAETASDAELTPDEVFGGWRTSALQSCELAVRASDGAAGSIAGIYRASCWADRERHLAGLIDAHVYFGDFVLVPMADARPRFEQCYETYDDALAQARTYEDNVDAAWALQACVTADARAILAAHLATAIAENEPGVATTELATEIGETLDQAFGEINAGCAIVSWASESAYHGYEGEARGLCMANGAAQLLELFLPSAY